MNCPTCGHNDSKVVDSRPSDSKIRRRRECLKCKNRFTTSEVIEGTFLVVLKKNGNTEPFDKEKLINRIQRATAKRPITMEQIDKIVDNIMDNIRKKYFKQVESNKIGEYVLTELKKIDQVSYIRFASVYRQFSSINDFIKTIEYISEL